MIDFERARRTMVDTQIRTGDVTDQHVLEAFLGVPREAFLPDAQRSLAYRDRAVQVAGFDGGTKRFLLDPLALAKLLQLADLMPTDGVLDVGCATGYAAAVIARIAGNVVALEEAPELAEKARTTLSGLAVSNSEVVVGPLTEGWAQAAPYDAIVVQGAIDAVPASLQEQLKEGGRLVAIIGAGMAAKAMLYRRVQGDFSGWAAFDAAAPPLPGFEHPPAFVF